MTTVKRRRKVTAHVDQTFELKRRGYSLRLDVASRGKRLGKLHIGRGSVIWFGRKWKTGRRLSWLRFAALMEA